MPLTITHATTAAACAAATTQIGWCDALLAEFAGAGATAKIYADGNVLRETLTLAAWTIDPTVETVSIYTGTRQTRTHASAGSIARLAFEVGGTEIFSFDAGVAGSGASVTFAKAIKALCRPNLDDIVITAPTRLPKFAASESELTTTVVNLAAEVTTPGFHTLTTTPNDSPLRNYVTVHQGSTYFVGRHCVYLYGDETHNITGQFGNAPYRFDIASGRVYRERVIDDWPGQYRLDAEGRAFATSAKVSPWGSHGQRQIVPMEDAFGWLFAYPTTEHAGWTGQVNEGAATSEKRMLWRWDAARNRWSYVDGGGGAAWNNIDEFLNTNVGHSVVRHPARNSLICCIGSFVRELALADYSITTSGTSPTAFSFNTYSFVLPDNTVLVAGGANVEATQLYAIVNPAAPAAPTVVELADVAALAGYQLNHSPWAHIGGWEFVVLAKDPTNVQMRAFRVNVQTGVWTDTGHTWAANATITSANGHYWLMVDYVPSIDLVTFAMRIGSVSGWYGYKPAR